MSTHCNGSLMFPPMPLSTFRTVKYAKIQIHEKMNQIIKNQSCSLTKIAPSNLFVIVLCPLSFHISMGGDCGPSISRLQVLVKFWKSQSIAP